MRLPFQLMGVLYVQDKPEASPYKVEKAVLLGFFTCKINVGISSTYKADLQVFLLSELLNC